MLAECWLRHRSSHSTFSCLLVLACPLAAHVIVISDVLLPASGHVTAAGMGRVGWRGTGAGNNGRHRADGRRGVGPAETAGVGME